MKSLPPTGPSAIIESVPPDSKRVRSAATSTSLILCARDVAFSYDLETRLIDALSLEVAAGALMALVGPNGAGKSTLLRLLAGILTPARGEVCLEGRSLPAWRPRARAQRIALLPQNPQVPTDMTVVELVRLGRYPFLGLRMFESPADLAIADRALAATDMSDFAGRRVETLSGGEAQRAHLAACLAQQPAVLLLDEPTSDLDLAHQLRIFNLLADLAHRDRIAVVVVTHDLNLAGRFADVVCVLDHGRIVVQGSPADVLRNPVLSRIYSVNFTCLEMPNAGPPLLVAESLTPPAGDAP